MRRRFDELRCFLETLAVKLRTAGSVLSTEAFEKLIAMTSAEWAALLVAESAVPGWPAVDKAIRELLKVCHSYVYYSDRAVRLAFQKTCTSEPAFCALVAGDVLTMLGLGKLVPIQPGHRGG